MRCKNCGERVWFFNSPLGEYYLLNTTDKDQMYSHGCTLPNGENAKEIDMIPKATALRLGIFSEKEYKQSKTEDVTSSTDSEKQG